MKRLFKVILSLMLILSMLLLAACSASSSKETTAVPTTAAGETTTAEAPMAEKIVIKLAHDNNTQAAGHLAFEKFAEMLSTETDGRITVEIYPSAQLGSVQDMFEQTRRGDIDMSVGASTLFVQTIPQFAVLDSFFIFDDAEHAHRVLDGKAGQELIKVLDSYNLVGIGFMEIGFRNFSNSKRPIMKAEDVKGLKIRGYSPMQIKAWEAAGASLSSLAWAEVFTSLQQKLIDGQESAIASFYDAKFHEAQPYLSITNHIYTNWMWYANKDFMNGLSTEDRSIIEDVAKKTIAYDRQLLADQQASIVEELPGLGVTINEVPFEEKQKLGELMNSAIKQDIISACGQEVYDMVNAEIVAERK